MQEQPQRRDDQQAQPSGLTFGLLFGPSMGLLASLIFEFDLALGLVFGAAIGMLVGLVADSMRRQ